MKKSPQTITASSVISESLSINLQPLHQKANTTSYCNTATMKNLLSLILACCLLAQISHVSAAENLRGSSGNSSTVTDQVSAEAPSVVETLSNLGQRLLQKMVKKERLKRQDKTRKKHGERRRKQKKLRSERRRKTKKKRRFNRHQGRLFG